MLRLVLLAVAAVLGFIAVALATSALAVLILGGIVFAPVLYGGLIEEWLLKSAALLAGAGVVYFASRHVGRPAVAAALVLAGLSAAPAWGAEYPTFGHALASELRCTTSKGRGRVIGTNAKGEAIYESLTGAFNPNAPWSYTLSATDAAWQSRYGTIRPFNGPWIGHTGPPAFTLDLARREGWQIKEWDAVRDTTDASYLMAGSTTCELAAAARLSAEQACKLSGWPSGVLPWPRSECTRITPATGSQQFPCCGYAKEATRFAPAQKVCVDDPRCFAEAPPPPPPMTCGDGAVSPGESCATCDQAPECPVVVEPPPPPPPEPEACTEMERTGPFRPSTASTGRLVWVLVVECPEGP